MISKTKSPRTAHTKPVIVVLAIILMVSAAYGLSLNNGFVWDDETFIVNNPYVYDLSQWQLYFTLPETVSDDPILSRMYRPIQTLSFALDAALWGTWAGGFHLTSLLLHLATCFAIFFAFAPLVGRRSAVIAAALFSVHPALSEGVLSLASRGNQLYTFFALISLGFFVKTVKPLDKYHFASLLAGLIALFSKEPAIAYLALLPLIQMAFGQPWPRCFRQALLLYTPFLMIAGLYLGARAAVVASSQVMGYWGGSLGATILLQAKVFISYFKLLIWPFSLQGRYTVEGLGSLAIVAIIANVVLAMVAVFAWRLSRRGKLLALAIAWFYISLAPVSNLIPLPGAMMGERFIYFTFAGMIPLLLGTVKEQVWDSYSRRIVPLALVLISAFLFTNITRTMVWKDNAHYFKVLSQQEPKNVVVQLFMANIELKDGDIQSALLRLERVVKTGFSSPFAEDKAKVFYSYGTALLLSDRPAEAYVQLSRAANLFSKRPLNLILHLAEAAARSNNLKAARTLLDNELKNSPLEDMLWNALGNVLTMTGDSMGAARAYSKALEIDPTNNEAAINLQNVQRSGTGKY